MVHEMFHPSTLPKYSPQVKIQYQSKACSSLYTGANTAQLLARRSYTLHKTTTTHAPSSYIAFSINSILPMAFSMVYFHNLLHSTPPLANPACSVYKHTHEYTAMHHSSITKVTLANLITAAC